MSSARRSRFDPRSILAVLQAAEVQSVLIGGLARVARGSDEVTGGVDICPSLQLANLARLNAALSEMGADGEAPIDETRLRAEPVAEVMTAFGELTAATTGIGREGYSQLKVDHRGREGAVAARESGARDSDRQRRRPCGLMREMEASCLVAADERVPACPGTPQAR